jgi:phosphoribosylaminoimidazole-succinocarboxamide synthase
LTTPESEPTSTAAPTVYESHLDQPLRARGKVRDIYETPDGILLVASDRLSAFDVVFPDPIPGKGAVLNRLAAYWFGQTRHLVPNHLITADSAEISYVAADPSMRNRCSLCRRATPFPVECVVRGYLEGSAWKDYLESGVVSGVKLPPGLKRRERLPEPIFTPSTKAEEGHDEPIDFPRVVELVGLQAASALRAISIELYKFAHEQLLPKGIILSDTKFEFGRDDTGEIILIDEALTPDSSRFWEAETYRPDADARSFDKQYVRDYVESIGWEKRPPAPRLPQEVINGMTKRYMEIYTLITGDRLD